MSYPPHLCVYTSSSPELIKPATSLYLHNLTGTLETAVRATNAQFETTDILNRLDVRMLDLSPGDHGWDVFSLHYHVTGPISTVSGGSQYREDSASGGAVCGKNILRPLAILLPSHSSQRIHES